MALKDWKRNKGMLQWESKKHPDFLFIRIIGSGDRWIVIRRLGNVHFNLDTPSELAVRKTKAQAIRFARSYMRSH